MSAPIFVDPVLDGAADPTVIWNAGRREWWMFYTNRRAGLDSPGAGWIHGSPIGIATSPDGVTWRYRGTAQGLDDPAHPGLNTHWAPEVIAVDGTYHMYLSYIEGAPDSFARRIRHLIHLTSPDLETWTRHGALPTSSENCIDAAVARTPDGRWRLWYKDEADGSSTWSMVGDDLAQWTLERRVIPGKEQGGRPHEGPNVFLLGGHYWLIIDEWRGQAVYRSADTENWTYQGLILERPGRDPMDRSFARHADVVVQDGWAACYYFTHPQWDEAAKPAPLTPVERRTVIHVAKLWVEDGVLHADRDVAPLVLTPP